MSSSPTTTTATPTTPPKPLLGKVICVTGASSGIGAAIAKELYQQGAHLVIGARRIQQLQEVANSIQKESVENQNQNDNHDQQNQQQRIVCVECDVTQRSSVQNFVQTAYDTFHVSSLDAMVACAGVMYFTEMKNALMDEWDTTIDVNCKGVSNCFGITIPSMVQAGCGKMITITSDAGVRPFPNLAMYCASKHFCEVLSEITRRELVGTGVTIHTVQPGDVMGTELILKNSDISAAEKMGVEIGKPVGTGFTRNQLLNPQDVANAVLTILTAPSHVAINSILIEPRDQE